MRRAPSPAMSVGYVIAAIVAAASSAPAIEPNPQLDTTTTVVAPVPDEPRKNEARP